MPTYEYECRQCGGQFEYLQSIVAPPMEKCETCGGPLTKLISAGTGLIFKGSGFYITDYKSPGAGKGDSGSASSPSASGEKKSGGGGEKKSESGGGESSGGKASDSTKSEGSSGTSAPAAAPAKKSEGA